MRSWECRWPSWFVACLLAMMLLFGCSRGYYRRQADQEVYGLVGCASRDPRWDLNDYTIRPDIVSRYYDPNCADRPPMPPDDPTSHELMQCVDGKPGWPFWNRNGCTPFVENPRWLQYLPRNEQNILVLDRPLALRVGLINAREYQTEREELYLTALDVTFQRFRFDAQFFGGTSTFFTADGPDRAGVSSSTLEVDNNYQLRKLNIFGGQLLVELANSFVWQFAGPDDASARTLLDFSLVQPLLRGAGRAVVMENLTQAERALLANVRQMERYRQYFYSLIMTGRATGAGPTRGGLILEAIGPTAANTTGGLYGILAAQIQIRNQEQNLDGLRESLDQIEAHYEAGRIDRLQVDIARQALYNAQSRLLSLKASYGDRVDAYKLTLGLPPQLDVEFKDDMLRQFDLVAPDLVALRSHVGDLLEEMRSHEGAKENAYFERVRGFRAEGEKMIALLAEDQQNLEKALPARRKALERLSHRSEVQNGSVDPSVCDLKRLDTRAADRARDTNIIRARFDELFAALDALPSQPAESGNDPPVGERLLPLTIRLSDILLALTLVQADTRLETVTLVPIEIDPAEAVRTACRCRLDWMNARAALVDAWRQIQVQANALRSDLNVTFSGDMSTLGNNPVRFRGTTGRLRVGVQFDPPLTRLVERNAYREALINYQRARRAYYAYEDRVAQVILLELRSLNQTQLDFELRRAGVRVAITQVDITRERLQAPPQVGQTDQTSGGQSRFGATAVRDLVQAYSGLLNAQDSFLSAWVDYEADRLNLDLDMGTMQLDCNGMWVDPGPITKGEENVPEAPLPEELPPPPGLPLQRLLDGSTEPSP